MEQAKPGDKVLINYVGKLADGTIFDSTGGRGAFEFRVGAGTVIPGFERAVLGMKPGDSKSQRIPADEAYGPHRGELVVEVERRHLPGGIEFGWGNSCRSRRRTDTPRGLWSWEFRTNTSRWTAIIR